jgi:hypothetical protein
MDKAEMRNTFWAVLMIFALLCISCSEQPTAPAIETQKKYIVLSSYERWAKEYGETVDGIKAKGQFINFWCKPETGSNVCGRAHPEERLEIISEIPSYYQTSKGWVSKSQVEKVEYGEANLKSEGIELDIKSLDALAEIYFKNYDAVKNGIPLTSKPEGGQITGRVYADEKVIATKVDSGIYYIKTKNAEFGWLHNKYVKEAKFR